MDPIFAQFQVALYTNTPIEPLLEANPDFLDQPDNSGRTIFSWACEYGRLDVINLLLQRKSQAVMMPNHYGSLPIHFACQGGHLEIMHRLIPLMTPSELTITNQGGRTPLWYIVRNNHVALIELFLDHAPETFFMVDANGTSILDLPHLLQQQTLIQLLFIGMDRFGAERMRPLILALPPDGQSVAERAYRLLSTEVISAIERIIPNPIHLVSMPSLVQGIKNAVSRQSSIFQQIIVEISAREEFQTFDFQSWKEVAEKILRMPPEIFPSAHPLFRERSLTRDQLVEMVFLAIYGGHDIAYTFFNQMGVDAYGEEWLHPYVTKLFLKREGLAMIHPNLLEAAIMRPSVGTMEAMCSLYGRVSIDPYTRGRIECQLLGFTDGGMVLHRVLDNMNEKDMDGARIWSSIFDLINRVSGPKMIWYMLDSGTQFEPLTIHAWRKNLFRLMEFFIWVGDTSIFEYPNLVHPTGRASVIKALNDTESVFEEDIQARKEIRYRIWFAPERTLTARLLFFV